MATTSRRARPNQPRASRHPGSARGSRSGRAGRCARVLFQQTEGRSSCLSLLALSRAPSCSTRPNTHRPTMVARSPPHHPNQPPQTTRRHPSFFRGEKKRQTLQKKKTEQPPHSHDAAPLGRAAGARRAGADRRPGLCRQGLVLREGDRRGVRDRLQVRGRHHRLVRRKVAHHQGHLGLRRVRRRGRRVRLGRLPGALLRVRERRLQ
jgi:hypothetical protein